MELPLLVGLSRNNTMKNVHELKSAFWCKLVRRYKQPHAPMYPQYPYKSFFNCPGSLTLRYSENVLPKFSKLCIETPCWCPFDWHKCGGRKPTETSGVEFFNKSVNISPEELRKLKVIFILRQRMFR